ncbi:MAG TPA: GNAT family N-acetyltransferase [Rhizomicrobium sp.]|nr:GNAT family N-acetyltransferase [Rhizomicrobium sp.]
MMIPRLETERLILREWRNEDFEPLAEFLADPDVMRYLGGKALTREEAWRNLCRSIGHWYLRGFGVWAVERKEDGALIGRIGLIYPEGWPGLEVGWTLGKPYWGMGYATEAARASMTYGFLTQPVARLISVIDPDNRASQGVATRIGETKGERRELAVDGEIFTADIWSIGREEWRRRAA